MREEIAWLKDAVLNTSIEQSLSHYCFSSNSISATNGHLFASVPFVTDFEAMVPARELERIINSSENPITVSVEDGYATIKSGRLRGTVPVMGVECFPSIDATEVSFTFIPDGLIDAAKKLKPFISDNAIQTWAMGLILRNGMIMATDNICLVCIECPEIGDGDSVVPLWAVDFIINNRADVGLWHWDEKAVWFKWGDGRFMRSTLVKGGVPDTVVNTVMKHKDQLTPVALTDEFKSIFSEIAGLADLHVIIQGGSVEADSGVAKMAVDVDSGVDKKTCWNAKVLGNVINVATHWDPDAYPSPSSFKGDNIFGVVVGRRM